MGHLQGGSLEGGARADPGNATRRSEPCRWAIEHVRLVMDRLTGGCACGAIRYTLLSSLFDAGYCHCRLCQLSSGAPVLAFATVPLGDFEVTRGAIAHRRSSQDGERGFCQSCGSPLTIHVTYQPETIDFTIATLDRPEEVTPRFHIWTESSIGWFAQSEALPRHARFRPDTVGLDAQPPYGEAPST